MDPSSGQGEQAQAQIGEKLQASEDKEPKQLTTHREEQSTTSEPPTIPELKAKGDERSNADYGADEVCNDSPAKTTQISDPPETKPSEEKQGQSINENPPILVEAEADTIDEDDGDPIPSGTGSVSKDCSASELVGWSEILPKWHSKLNQRPKGLNVLVRNGIPEPLRGEVWQLMSGAQQCSELMDKYRLFLLQSAPTEQNILRDVHRTYPAHENFRSGGVLLDSLFKVCKAYAVYDEEVGYCQGLSFLVAALLLHMPEEQAFCVFVRIMQHYGLRDLFRNNFDELYLKFYQLEHLLEDHMPDLHQHFKRIGIEPFTYASQWFLTVFTAKFPLNAVFYIMDIFLLDGMDTIFQVALALLKASKQELIALDFEGVLKYFRVQMPKRYISQEKVQQLINASSEISLKKLKKYAKSYEAMNRIKRENAKLAETNSVRLSDIEDEKTRLEVEVCQLKEVFRRELHRAESESVRDSNIISDYKKICKRLEGQLDSVYKFIESAQESLQDNEACKDKSCCLIFQTRADEFIKNLKSDTKQHPMPTDSPKRRISTDSEQSNRRIGAYIISNDSQSTSSEAKIQHLTQHIDELEVELARTKLALVEAECKCQQLTHELSVGVAIRNPNSSPGQANNQSYGGISGKLDFMKAVSAHRSPPKVAASAALAKINMMISEKISNISATSPVAPASISINNNNDSATLNNATLISDS